MAMNRLEDEAKKKAIAPDPISAAAGGVQAANATKAALVNQASARPAWAASAANPAPAPQGQQAYQMFAPTTAATNQQLQMQRQEMGTNNTSLTQMASKIDPSIRRDAERAREWRIMSPQQRREEVDRLAMEQDAGIAKTASSGTWEDRDKYARSLADPTGMFIDSYGRENPMYSPGTADRIRNYQRKIEPAIARMMSSYDRTKWDSPQAYLDAASALPEVIEAGEFGKAIVFNIGRKYATPQMRAQMEAEDRNQKLFKDWMVSRGAEELAKAQEQNGGFRFTNDGTEDVATQIALNRDKDLASGQIWRKFLEETPQVYTAMDGKVQIDQAHNAKYVESRRKMENEQQLAVQESKAKQAQSEKTAQAVAASKKKAEVLNARAGYEQYVVNEVDGKLIDTKQVAEKPQERSQVETVYKNARTTMAQGSRVLEIQAMQPVDYLKYALAQSGADMTMMNQIIESKRIPTKEDIAMAKGDYNKFMELVAERDSAMIENPAVIQARIKAAQDEAAKIEREYYGVFQ